MINIIILSLRKSQNHVRVLVKTKISEWNFDLVCAVQVLSLHTFLLLRSDKGWRSTVTPIFNRVSFSELKFWIEMLIYCICLWERKLHKWTFWVNILIYTLNLELQNMNVKDENIEILPWFFYSVKNVFGIQ